MIKINKFKRNFTLVEVIIVIIIISVLATMVIQGEWFNQDEAEDTVFEVDIENIQTAIDMMIQKGEELPIDEEPTLGKPQLIDVDKLVPKHLREKPVIGNFWLDYNYTVYGTTTKTTDNVKTMNGKVTWDKVQDAESYEMYTINEANTKSKRLMPLGINVTHNKYVGEEVKSDEHYFIASVDKGGNETPPVNNLFIDEISEKPIETPITEPDEADPNRPTNPNKPEGDLDKLLLGDFVQFGKHYNEEPIIWNVVKKEADSVMLFMREPVKDIHGNYMKKMFDPKPKKGEPVDMNRQFYGSNNYATSTYREWLNNEFLNEAFENSEIISNSTVDYTLSTIDMEQATSGTEPHIYNSAWVTALQNYNTAYKGTVTDKIFPVNIEELINHIEPLIGYDYYNNLYAYWTRDAYSLENFSSYTRVVQTYGSISYFTSNTELYIKIALNLDSGNIKDGDGTMESPYIIK